MVFELSLSLNAYWPINSGFTTYDFYDLRENKHGKILAAPFVEVKSQKLMRSMGKGAKNE